MARNSTVYRKADSFAGIRHRALDAEEVRARLREFCLSREIVVTSGHREQIVAQACHDLLDDASSEDSDKFRLGEYALQEIMGISKTDLSRYLYYRYRYEMFPRQRRLDGFPPCLQIEPSSVCNYRCVFCYQTDREFTDRRKGHMGQMGLNLFKRIIDQAEGNCEAVTLASRGEPLLHPNITDMLKYAGGKFLGLKVNTNASVLNEPICHAILMAQVNVLVFSVDASSAPLYSSLRKGGDFERVVNNVKQFQDIRAKHYPHAKTVTRISGVKICEDQCLEEIESFWRELVDQVALVTYNPWECTYVKPPASLTDHCSDLWRRMFVWFDGTVNPCDIDYRSTLAVGNASKELLTDIWTGKRYAELRANHLSGNRGNCEPCRRCTFL